MTNKTTRRLKEASHYDVTRRFKNVFQLAASTCWIAVFNNLTVQPLQILRALAGPFPTSFCFVQTLLISSMLMEIVLLMLAMIVAKYVSIFVLSNPVGIQIEFWSVLTLLSFLCSFTNIYSYRSCMALIVIGKLSDVIREQVDQITDHSIRHCL